MIAGLRHELTRLRFSNPCRLFKSNAISLLRSSASGEGQPEIRATLYESLVHKHRLSPRSASQISAVARHLRYKPERADSVVSFLRESGFSDTQLEKMMKFRPILLFVDVERVIKPKIGILHEFGISAGDVAEIISKDPWILRRSVDLGLIPSLSVLKELLGSDELGKVLKASGWYLKSDLATNLVPNIDLLRKCGVAMDQIVWMMYHFPRFLLRLPKRMSRLVERADGMGVSRCSKMFIYAVRVLSSMSEETWRIKLRVFRAVGFSEDEIVAAFRQSPVVFCMSEEKIKVVKEVLLANGKYDLSCIINNPGSLLYSVERRYKPRMKVLEALEREQKIRCWPSFTTFFAMSDKVFCEKYVVPYLHSIGDVCVADSAANGKLVLRLIQFLNQLRGHQIPTDFHPPNGELGSRSVR